MEQQKENSNKNEIELAYKTIYEKNLSQNISEEQKAKIKEAEAEKERESIQNAFFKCVSTTK